MQHGKKGTMRLLNQKGYLRGTDLVYWLSSIFWNRSQKWYGHGSCIFYSLRDYRRKILTAWVQKASGTEQNIKLFSGTL